jgi:L-alanine-DL-glutamate epimerase-like enolase superfamily enzyme
MRLAEWDTYPMHIPYPGIVKWASTSEDGADYLLLRLVGDDGTVGLAEGVVKTAWSGATFGILAAALQELFIPMLGEIDLLDEAAVTRTLGKVRENRLARSMIDMACWDLRSQARGVPLWKLWGGEPDVAVSWTVTRKEGTAMAREAETMVGRHGFRTLKVKGGQGREFDRVMLAEMRTAVGPEVALYVDANSAYTQDETPAYLQELADQGVVAAEDPCRLAPNRAFSRLQGESPIPILVDNACGDARDTALFLEQGARALSLKPSKSGFSESRRMAALAEAQECAVSVGIMGETSMGALMGLQLASAIPHRPPSLPAELSFFLTLADQYVSEPLRIEDGRIRLPDLPGFARFVDWERVRALQI